MVYTLSKVQYFVKQTKALRILLVVFTITYLGGNVSDETATEVSALNFLRALLSLKGPAQS